MIICVFACNVNLTSVFINHLMQNNFFCPVVNVNPGLTIEKGLNSKIAIQPITFYFCVL